MIFFSILKIALFEILYARLTFTYTNAIPNFLKFGLSNKDIWNSRNYIKCLLKKEINNTKRCVRTLLNEFSRLRNGLYLARTVLILPTFPQFLLVAIIVFCKLMVPSNKKKLISF